MQNLKSYDRFFGFPTSKSPEFRKIELAQIRHISSFGVLKTNMRSICEFAASLPWGGLVPLTKKQKKKKNFPLPHPLS